MSLVCEGLVRMRTGLGDHRVEPCDPAHASSAVGGVAGYGDIVPTPRCVQGRVMTIFLMLAGSMIMITVLSEFLEMMDRKRAAFRKDLAKERHKETGLYEIKRLLG